MSYYKDGDWKEPPAPRIVQAGIEEPSGTCDICTADTVVQLVVVNYRDKRMMDAFSKFGHCKEKRDGQGKKISQTLHIDRGEFVSWWQRCAKHYPKT